VVVLTRPQLGLADGQATGKRPWCPLPAGPTAWPGGKPETAERNCRNDRWKTAQKGDGRCIRSGAPVKHRWKPDDLGFVASLLFVLVPAVFFLISFTPDRTSPTGLKLSLFLSAPAPAARGRRGPGCNPLTNCRASPVDVDQALATKRTQVLGGDQPGRSALTSAVLADPATECHRCGAAPLELHTKLRAALPAFSEHVTPGFLPPGWERVSLRPTWTPVSNATGNVHARSCRRRFAERRLPTPVPSNRDRSVDVPST